MAAPVDIGTLTLDPPLVNGSGAVDVVAADPDWNVPEDVVRRLGAFVTKTVTRRAREGNARPWAETIGDASLVNAVGLANPGIDLVMCSWRELPAQLGIPVIVSIGGNAAELPDLARDVAAAGWAAGIELNLSCPNVDGGLLAADATAVARVVREVRKATTLPLLAKLTPACGSPAAIARAAVAAGADALTCGNTMPIRAVDEAGAAVLGAGPSGGLSGAQLHPMSLRLVAEAAGAVDVPIIGLGGIDDAASIRRMQDAGARVFGVGTAAVFDPQTIVRLADALARGPATAGDGTV